MAKGVRKNLIVDFLSASFQNELFSPHEYARRNHLQFVMVNCLY